MPLGIDALFACQFGYVLFSSKFGNWPVPGADELDGIVWVLVAASCGSIMVDCGSFMDEPGPVPVPDGGPEGGPEARFRCRPF